MANLANFCNSEKLAKSVCAFGSSLYKTFRRHGLHLRGGLIHPVNPPNASNIYR